MMKVVPPTISASSFSCPHCGSYTTQQWFNAWADFLGQNESPSLLTEDTISELVHGASGRGKEVMTDLRRRFNSALSGQPILSGEHGSRYASHMVCDVNFSECYVCGGLGIWLRDRLIYPTAAGPIASNSDMPPDIKADFDEASSIVESSPRGAAALLRLCVQKLCAHLGEKGKNIDDDIASLVKKGLDPLVQQSLDIVRVIGNNAVHPGELDLKDDRDTAITLLELVNAITEAMISHPKKVQEMYSRLPQSKRDAIARRDGTQTPPAAPGASSGGNP